MNPATVTFENHGQTIEVLRNHAKVGVIAITRDCNDWRISVSVRVIGPPLQYTITKEGCDESMVDALKRAKRDANNYIQQF